MIGDQVGVVGANDGVVGRGDITGGRVETEGQFIKGNIALPLVFARPARDSIHAVVPVYTNGDVARHLVADIAVYIGVEQVLSGDNELACRGTKIIPVLGAVKFPDRAEDARGFKRRPVYGKGVIFGHFDSSIFGEGFQPVICGDDRAMLGNTDGVFDDFAASNFNLLGDNLHIDPLALEFVLVRVFGVDLLDVEVHHIGANIGEAPGYAVVVADDDTRNPGERIAVDIHIAVFCFGEAV